MPILGTKKTLRHISSKPDFPLNWMKTHYTPDRMVVFCQGNIKPEKIFRLAEKEFSGVTSRNTREIPAKYPRNTRENGLENEHERSFKKHTHQVHAMLGGKAYPIGHEDQLTMFLLNNILGGGSLNSRLNLSLREAKGLVYTIESTYTPLSDTGYWCVYWACDPEDFPLCRELVENELHKFRTHPMTESGLKHSMEQLRGQLAISAQNQENSALAMAKSVLYRGEAPNWQEVMTRIEQTTPEQLLKVAQEIFIPEKTFILTYK